MAVRSQPSRSVAFGPPSLQGEGDSAQAAASDTCAWRWHYCARVRQFVSNLPPPSTSDFTRQLTEQFRVAPFRAPSSPYATLPEVSCYVDNSTVSAWFTCRLRRAKLSLAFSFSHFRIRNDLYCVGWGVKLYSLTLSPTSRYSLYRFSA